MNIKSVGTDSLSKFNFVSNQAKLSKSCSSVGQVSFNGLDALANQNSHLVHNFKEQDKKIMLEDLKHSSYISEKEFSLADGKTISLEVYGGTQRGSNFGYFALDKKNNELYYVKFGGEQSSTEVLASKIYEKAGIDVAQMTLIKDKNGKKGLISKYIPNLTTVGRANEKVNDGYGIDILLANWDSVCSCNAQTDGEKVYRIDFGGALDFRAQGAHKSSFYNTRVVELTTMINPRVNWASASIFSSMTRDSLIKYLDKVANLDNEFLKDISKIYRPDDANLISNTLIKRKEYLTNILKQIKDTPMKKENLLEYLYRVEQKVQS